MGELLFGRGRSSASSVCWVVLSACTLALLGLLVLWSVTTVYGEAPHRHVLKQGSFILLAVAAGVVTALERTAHGLALSKKPIDISISV